MWTVERPSFDASMTFKTCISRVRDAKLRDRLASIEPLIAAAAIDYEAKANAHILNLFPRSTSVGGVVTKAEMIKVYDQRMAGKEGPGRAIYDQIKLLPKGDRCPFCDQRNVSTLDHILPKTLYSNLTVTPLNLVAACMECNKTKLSTAPLTASKVVLHPYFDDISKQRWLTATIVQQIPCAITFDIVRPASWDDTTHARARRQFSLLDLANLYSSEAARELANIRYNLEMHLDAGGVIAVQRELLRQCASRKAARLNSWQTAMYEATAHDIWFCSGGFR
jgi:hypothetical protein